MTHPSDAEVVREIITDLQHDLGNERVFLGSDASEYLEREIAAALARVRAEEREACASMCEPAAELSWLASAIRARVVRADDQMARVAEVAEPPTPRGLEVEGK